MPQRRRIVDIVLDEKSVARRTPEVEHERAVALFDLLEENEFAPDGGGKGPFKLNLSITGNRLAFDIRHTDDTPVMAHLLSLSPLRRIVKDYYMVCDSYYAAIRTATPDRIEALDMGRRGLHDEGSELLRERLAGKIRNAGAIFLGAHTPEAIGDYVGGSNHVLPTARSARYSSGLSVLDFMKRTSILKCGPEQLRALGPAAIRLGRSEGLEGHARSVAIRLNL